MLILKELTVPAIGYCWVNCKCCWLGEGTVTGTVFSKGPGEYPASTVVDEQAITQNISSN